MKTIARKTQVVSISLPKKAFRQLEETRKVRGQSRSAFITTLIDKEDEEREWQKLRKLGEEMRKKFNITSEDDIDRMIHEYREENRASK